jgi:acyl-ACP thioesterase
MANWILVHRDTGEPLLINLDLVISIESHEQGGYIRLSNGETEFVKESFQVFQRKMIA